MSQKEKLKRDDLVYAKECYELVNALFEVYKQLGSGYQEKYYQRGLAREFVIRKWDFEEQVFTPLYYKEEKVGNYFIDFVVMINGIKIVLEIKKDEYFSKRHIDQVVGYLKSTGLKLGVLANFTPRGVKYKRIVNL
jgi:GxxExxY protein